MTDRKPDASSQPSFSDRVDAAIEYACGVPDSHPPSHETINTLLACIREQQAALERVTEQYQKVRDADEAYEGIESSAIAEARAVLARWRIE